MRKFNIIAIVTALAASTLAGCGTANTKIDFDPDHIIASIKDSDVKLDYATANTYVRIMQAETYDYAQGVMEEDETPSDDIWSEVLTEKTENGYQTYGEVFKDETLDNLKTMLVSEEHMDDYNITFTDDEQERWNTVADDFVEKNALEKLHKFAKKYDADVVRYSRSYRTVKDGKVIAEEKTSFKAGVYSSSQFAANFDQINKAGEGIWAGIYRRAFLQKNQIDFDETMKFGYEDLDFITKIYLCSPSVVLNPKTYYVWIMRYAHSTSGKTDINNITSLMKCLENKSRLVTQTGIETQIPAFWVEELSRRIYTIVRYVSPKKVKMPFGKRIELLKYFRTAAVFQQPTDKKKTKAFKKQSKPGWLIWYLFDKKHYWLLYFLVTGKQRLSEK